MSSPDRLNPYASFQPEPEPVPARHSRLGICSVALGVLGWMFAVGALVLAGMIAHRIQQDGVPAGRPLTPADLSPEVLNEGAFAGCLMLVCLGISAVGTALAVGALLAGGHQKRLLGVIGMLLNGCLLFGCGGTFILGLLLQ